MHVWKTGFYGREATMDILALFCDLDNFAIHFQQRCRRPELPSGKRRRHRQSRMHLSEVMTILVLFHASNYRTFKHFYLFHVRPHLRSEFPHLVSYSRFIELVPEALLALVGFLHTRKGRCTGVSFIDSTPLRVCHNLRIHSHRVMAGLAQRGKTSVGWFFGFKLHLLVNDQGELLEVCITPGNIDDRDPVDALTKKLWGKLFGDKGYLSQPLFQKLFGRGVQLFTRLKSNMKNRLIPLIDKLLLRKRAIVETIIDQLKNISQIEHSRHRGVPHYFVDILAGLVAYTYREKLPSLNLSVQQHQMLLGIPL
jgi:Transposase DDE domain